MDKKKKKKSSPLLRHYQSRSGSDWLSETPRTQVMRTHSTISTFPTLISYRRWVVSLPSHPVRHVWSGVQYVRLSTYYSYCADQLLPRISPVRITRYRMIMRLKGTTEALLVRWEREMYRGIPSQSAVYDKPASVSRLNLLKGMAVMLPDNLESE